MLIQTTLRSPAARRQRRRGQSLVEFALVVPILVLLVGTAIDAGRLYFGYVSLVNAAKEGSLFGAKSPTCDVPGVGCGDPNNVTWRVNAEAGTGVSQTVTCTAPDGTPRGSLGMCAEGDEYQVALTRQFDLINPAVMIVLGPSLTLGAESSAVVFNPGTLPPPTATPTPVPTPTPTPSPTPVATPTPGPVCSAPVINFTGNPLMGTGPLSVQFTGTSNLAPVSILWTFGDGAQDTTSLTPTHVYAAVTNNTQYDVTLTVRTGSDDTCASTESKRNYVMVKKP